MGVGRFSRALLNYLKRSTGGLFGATHTAAACRLRSTDATRPLNSAL